MTQQNDQQMTLAEIVEQKKAKGIGIVFEYEHKRVPVVKQKKNFFGMRYIDPTGDGTGRSVKWAGVNDVFNGNVDLALLQTAKRLKNFYYGVHGGTTMYNLAMTGYAYGKDKAAKEDYAYGCASIMAESLDYIIASANNN